MRAHNSILFLPILMLLLCNGSGGAADASEAAHAAPMQPEPLQDALGPDASRTGRDIYQCVLDNRFDSYVQHSKLLSGDRGGAVQASELRMTWSSLRDPDGEPSDGVLSKTIVKYLDPFDLRFSGYLIINNHARKNDQFVYLATTRRIRRVNLRREAVFGTDFTFEDLVQRTQSVMNYLADFLGIQFVDILLTPTFNKIPIKPNTSLKLEKPGIMLSALERYKTLCREELNIIEELTGDAYAQVIGAATSIP